MEMTDIEKRVNAAIQAVRPYLQADGGDIELLEVTPEMVAKVRLQGACGSCPFSVQTLKNGVEGAIKKEVPEIVEVVNVAE